MSTPHRLPIGISAFEVIRQRNFIYVDKTQHIYNMVDEAVYYFLARPRRFGKSLLVSTLWSFFEGRRDLFEGLWIDQHSDWEWEEHAVLIFDFNGIDHRNPEMLENGLLRRMETLAERHEIPLKRGSLKEYFQELIVGIKRKTGKSVVVLVDEYDKPIIDHLGQGEEAMEIAKANRTVLKFFFGVLKEAEVSKCLRFVFLTGISKFSRVSIFSELNNLEDISMQKEYSDICGYTEAELEHCFSARLQSFAEELNCSHESLMSQLAQQYNGYRFSESGNSVYNPFSLLNALKQSNLKGYWFESGSPSFLINLLKEQQFNLPQVEHLELDAESFSTYELENLDPHALLFQTGYATIQDYDDGVYTLGYPNREVRSAFLKHLFKSYTEIKTQDNTIRKLMPLLWTEDYEGFFELMKSHFAKIPHVLIAQQKTALQNESYFHTAFYLMIAASGGTVSARNGGSVRNEVLTNQGRIDMVVEFSDKVFILEFKCNQSAEVAQKQIADKGYADPFRNQGKKVVCLGINFSTEEKNITEWDKV